MVIWLQTFGLTFIVELLVAYPLLGLAKVPALSRIILVLVANAITHPIVFFATAPPIAPESWIVRVVLLEGAAAVVESIAYARAVPKLLAIATSFLSNAASLFLSLLFYYA